MKFVKKPVTIDAIQFTLDDAESYCVMSDTWGRPFQDAVDYFPDVGQLKIRTLEGSMIAKHGDWIIRGVKGEFYPCKPDIFAATYELASTGTDSTS